LLVDNHEADYGDNERILMQFCGKLGMVQRGKVSVIIRVFL